jgi:hypothetical protein
LISRKTALVAMLLSFLLFTEGANAKGQILVCEGTQFSKHTGKTSEINAIVEIGLTNKLLTYYYLTNTFVYDEKLKSIPKGLMRHSQSYRIVKQTSENLLVSQIKGKRRLLYVWGRKRFEVGKDVLATGKLNRIDGTFTLETHIISDMEKNYGWKRKLKCRKSNLIS